MDPGARTHRDTLAFVLVMTGISAWSLFPAYAILRETTEATLPNLAAALLVGCAAGAWVAASVYRGVPRSVAVVAGALTAALSLGLVHVAEHREMPPLGAWHIAIVAGAGAVAMLGAMIGARMKTALTGVAGAAMVMATFGSVAFALELANPPDDSALDTLFMVLFFASPIGGAAAVAYLCRAVDPASVARWTFFFSGSVFAVIALADRDEESLGVLGGGVIFAFMVAAMTASVIRKIQLRRRPLAPASVPTAQVVDR